MTTARFPGEGQFTDWLRERSEPEWTDATGHRFTRELADDTIDDAVFRRYLVQDYDFVRTLARVFAHAAGKAPELEATVRLADFLTTVGTDENDYFERSFDALSVPEHDRTAPERHPVTEQFEDLLLRAAGEGGYAESLSVLVPAEWVYLTWASRAGEGDLPERFYLAEWIELHAIPEFEEFVGWLRGELDAVGPELSPRRQRRVDRLFRRTVELEVAFFDAAFEEHDP